MALSMYQQYNLRNANNPVVFFDITIGTFQAGRIVMELFADVVPKVRDESTFLRVDCGEFPTTLHRRMQTWRQADGIQKLAISSYNKRFHDTRRRLYECMDECRINDREMDWEASQFMELRSRMKISHLNIHMQDSFRWRITGKTPTAASSLLHVEHAIGWTINT